MPARLPSSCMRTSRSDGSSARTASIAARPMSGPPLSTSTALRAPARGNGSKERIDHLLAARVVHATEPLQGDRPQRERGVIWPVAPHKVIAGHLPREHRVLVDSLCPTRYRALATLVLKEHPHDGVLRHDPRDAPRERLVVRRGKAPSLKPGASSAHTCWMRPCTRGAHRECGKECQVAALGVTAHIERARQMRVAIVSR